MYIKTVKLKRPVFMLLVTLIAAGLVVLAGLCAVKASAGRRVYKVKTEQQRQQLIRELGWETGEKPLSHKTITIPDRFDKVYEGYNRLQKEQGFDLTPYRGKKAEVYTYKVYNYKGHKDCMQLTLIGCGGELIAGDVCCTELDGFMQGLAMEKQKK